MTSTMFNHKVTIENHRLDLSQERVFAVDVAPARLNHTDLRVTEVVHDVFEEIGRRNKIGIEDCYQLTACGLQPMFQRAGFKTVTICPMDMVNVETKGAMTGHACCSNFNRTVSGVVQEL